MDEKWGRFVWRMEHGKGLIHLDGYYPRTLEEIYDNERAGVENLIWDKFNNNKDVELAQFLPKLQLYDGIAALKDALKESKIPSSNSVTIAHVLYEYLNDERYLDIIKENIDKDPNNISYVSVLAYCKPCQKAYRILLEENPLVCHTYRSIFMAMIQPVLKESLTSFCHRAN